MHDLARYKTSAIALVVANSLPLLGVLFFDWDAFAIVALYWVENVVIGAINVLKMIACSPDLAVVKRSKLVTAEQMAELEKTWATTGAGSAASLLHHGAKLFFVPFFIFHYGMFCFGHGVFIVSIFGRETGMSGIPGGLADLTESILEAGLGWAAAALAASHLWSFVVNYLGRGEYRRTFVPILMFQPYGRIVVLHVAILLGMFAALALGSNIGVLAILVIGKTALDLGLHLWERRFNAGHDMATATG